MTTTTTEAAAIARLMDNLSQVLSGRPAVVRTVVAVFLAQGHLLIEDVPGVGKTTLAKALARSVGGTMGRVQFTPDLLPSDLTGVSVYRAQTGDFEFHPGPLFATVVIGDEINRASPKTQSALLECMQERQVTVDGTTHPLPDPFMVIATQNPVEMAGTYPLPEAQRDRFMAQVRIGYPAQQDELELLATGGFADPLADLDQALTDDEIQAARLAVRAVYVSDAVRGFILDLVRATRRHEEIALGASPRAGLQLLAMAKALAVVQGRDFVLPDDIQEIGVSVLAHRVVARRGASAGPAELIGQILRGIPAPGPS
ncbi:MULTISPECIES: AAA family ATPase [unclassified Pseudactinotalea]|uniref:AAA family ATPase n=1 Tax=unclassified Pseudactinotalea TaxID=2649176 RepID=UPI003C7CAD3C